MNGNEAIEQLAGTFKEVGGREQRGDGRRHRLPIPLAEILQVTPVRRCSASRASSGSPIQRASIQIWIRQGLVDFVSSRGQPEEFRLGRYFVQKGLATRDQIDAVVSQRLAPGKLLGEMLVEEGLATREELNVALTRQSSD